MAVEVAVAHRALAWLARHDDNAGKVSEQMAAPVATRSDPVKMLPRPVPAPLERGETGLVFPFE
ncbi:hypothetical protein CF141_01310 [Aeromonas hydrophila]|nr:hypothetical protein CF141_01310 [Aeromonas hydrophila]